MKKLLALVLALVMTLSLAVVGSNAAFKDAKDTTETYAEAVDVLSGMGVFNGYKNADGTYSFQPKGEITRAEVAAIVYRIYTADVKDKNISLYAGYGSFTDLAGANWAKGYIGYCANAGLVKGYDAKTFGPSDKVTGYQALAMILRAMGYDKNNEFTGSQWELHVAQIADQLEILKNVGGESLSAHASRQLVAELLFQAIQKPCVTYTPAFGYVATTVVGAQASLGVKNFGLTKTDYDYDKWGRPSYVWYNDSNKNGSYQSATETVYAEIAAKPVKTYTAATTECQIASDLGLKADQVFAKVTKNGVPNTTAIGNDSILQVLATNSNVGAQGQLVEIYVVKGAYQAVIIDTYLAKVTNKSDLKYDAAGHLSAQASISFNAAKNVTGTFATDATWTADADDYVAYTLKSSTANYEYAIGDFILVNLNENPAATSDIVSAATSLTGKQTIWNYNTGKTTVEGTVYNNAVKYLHNEAGQDNTKTYTWFFDSYGNLIGNVLVATTYDYATISTLQWINPVGAAGYATAKLTYMDGTTAEKTVTKINDKVLSCSEYNPATVAGAASYANGYVSLNWEKNLDEFCDEHLFRVTNAADGSVVLEHVFDGATYAAVKHNQAGDNATINHTTGVITFGSKKATLNPAYSIITDGNASTDTNVVATDSTVYLIQKINTATVPATITYDVVTGYKNIPAYTNSAVVDYVLENGYVKYAFVIGTPDSTVTDGLFYLSTLTGYEYNLATKTWTFTGYVDGEANTIQTKDSAIASYLSGHGTDKLYFVEYVGGLVTAIYEAQDGNAIQTSYTASAPASATVQVSNVAYNGQNVKIVSGAAGDKWFGEVYTDNGTATYATAGAKIVNGAAWESDMSGKNVVMTVKTLPLGVVDYSVQTAYIVDKSTNAAVPAVTITATKNGVPATSPVTATAGVDTVVLTATVTNADKCKSLTYQWYNNSGAIVGATGNTYTVPKTVAAADNYYCLATNADDTKSGTKIATTAPASVLSVSVTVNAAAAVVTPTSASYDSTTGKITFTFTATTEAGVINATLKAPGVPDLTGTINVATGATTAEWYVGNLKTGIAYQVTAGEFTANL